MPSIYDLPAVDALAKDHKLDPHFGRRLLGAFCRRQRTPAEALAELPVEHRATFADAIEFHPLELHSRHDSALDGATKLIFRTRQGLLVESVILRLSTGRTALCVSTQVGCAANCAFCATGKMGIARNLSAADILDQLARAGQLLRAEGRRVRNLVLMGMGEPFHNVEAVYQAIDVVTDRRAFNLDPRRILISTVGIPAAMVACARQYPGVRLALSLHSARAEVRRQLIPLAERYSLAELREALVEVTTIQQHEVMIEYLLLAGLTDTDEDITALVEYLSGIPVHINLIPYNPIADAPHLVGSACPRREAFSAALKAAGFQVTTRYSLGADIAAACGQLVRQEHRAGRLTAHPSGG